MAKKYGKKNMGRSSSGGIGSLMLAFVSFTFGYLIATVFDTNQLSGWVNKQLLSKSTPPSQTKTAEQPQLPKPKFEFYTLLTKEGATETVADAPSKPEHTSTASTPQTPVSSVPSVPTPEVALTATQKSPSPEPVAVANQAAKPVIVPPANSERFIVQVASFRNIHEAEKMKAALMMKGFDVAVVMMRQQQVNWYRIVIGPYTSRTKAQQAQASFAQREHIVGMVRKMDS